MLDEYWKYTMCAPHHLEGGLRPVLPECRATTPRSCAHAHRAVGRFTLFMILAFEATTAFSRQRNMQTLRGMSNKAFSLEAYRNGSWQQVSSTDLVPGDLISLKRAMGNDTTLVPADCVLLRGTGARCRSTTTPRAL